MLAGWWVFKRHRLRRTQAFHPVTEAHTHTHTHTHAHARTRTHTHTHSSTGQLRKRKNTSQNEHFKKITPSICLTSNIPSLLIFFVVFLLCQLPPPTNYNSGRKDWHRRNAIGTFLDICMRFCLKGNIKWKFRFYHVWLFLQKQTWFCHLGPSVAAKAST